MKPINTSIFDFPTLLAKGGPVSSGKTAVSSPAVEMVWFQAEPQVKGAGDFGGVE